MTYDELPEELRTELETTRFAAFRRGASVEDSSINDVILLRVGSPIDANRLDGYTISGTPRVWFDEVVTKQPEEDQERMVRESLTA